ncbi:MAG: SpoIIIAH-like family protein [Vulcanibacillus sp.]
MREIKRKSRQTVWLLTMVTVMIVLSAYYLLSEPLFSTDMWSAGIENINKEVINEDNLAIEELDLQEMTNSSDYIPEEVSSNSDFILGIKMERDNNRSKQIDTYFTMMQTNLSEEAILEINNKIENLQVIEESEYVLEKLISTDGYEDVVVFSNNVSADVIIQTKKLTNENAVKIIKLVSERLVIPAVNVHIKIIN